MTKCLELWAHTHLLTPPPMRIEWLLQDSKYPNLSGNMSLFPLFSLPFSPQDGWFLAPPTNNNLAFSAHSVSTQLDRHNLPPLSKGLCPGATQLILVKPLMFGRREGCGWSCNTRITHWPAGPGTPWSLAPTSWSDLQAE